jgi:hypothetical protein
VGRLAWVALERASSTGRGFRSSHRLRQDVIRAGVGLADFPDRDLTGPERFPIFECAVDQQDQRLVDDSAGQIYGTNRPRNY